MQGKDYLDYLKSRGHDPEEAPFMGAFCKKCGWFLIEPVVPVCIIISEEGTPVQDE